MKKILVGVVLFVVAIVLVIKFVVPQVPELSLLLTGSSSQTVLGRFIVISKDSTTLQQVAELANANNIVISSGFGHAPGTGKTNGNEARRQINALSDGKFDVTPNGLSDTKTDYTLNFFISKSLSPAQLLTLIPQIKGTGLVTELYMDTLTLKVDASRDSEIKSILLNSKLFKSVENDVLYISNEGPI